MDVIGWLIVGCSVLAGLAWWNHRRVTRQRWAFHRPLLEVIAKMGSEGATAEEVRQHLQLPAGTKDTERKLKLLDTLCERGTLHRHPQQPERYHLPSNVRVGFVGAGGQIEFIQQAAVPEERDDASVH